MHAEIVLPGFMTTEEPSTKARLPSGVLHATEALGRRTRLPVPIKAAPDGMTTEALTVHVVFREPIPCRSLSHDKSLIPTSEEREIEAPLSVMAADMPEDWDGSRSLGGISAEGMGEPKWFEKFLRIAREWVALWNVESGEFWESKGDRPEPIANTSHAISCRVASTAKKLQQGEIPGPPAQANRRYFLLPATMGMKSHDLISHSDDITTG